ncbi:hypothetical protein CK203_043277 [Vitis vinifera]|uniref:Uncharacterized protein n=1 Tax=Vitis vinifera TaxID=29760 RepID=A0A438HP78_VITVI|nr:hypothetical protein CK203_043277 [Vitis vinifera]
MRGSACVEVMTTLHGSAPSLRRRAEGCVLPEDPPIRTPSLHVGVSEGLQSLFSYSSDPIFPLFSLQLRVLGDRYELSMVGQFVSSWMHLPVSVQTIIHFILFLYRILIRFSPCQDQISFAVWTHLLGSELRAD